MKASLTTLVFVSIISLFYGSTSVAAAPRGFRHDLSQTEEVCVNPTQCVAQDDCCCGYVCAISGFEDPLPACYPINNAYCPPKGPFHKAKQRKNGSMGCTNPDRCLHETDCCCGFICVTKVGVGKSGLLDPVCAAVYDGRCPPEYEESNFADQAGTVEANGRADTLGDSDFHFSVNGYPSGFKQGIAGVSVEDKLTGCRSLGDLCDIFHTCCVGYSCVDHQEWDPLRKGFCKTVMMTGESELKK